MLTHAAFLVQSFLAKHQITQLTQPPCSSDMAPCVFCLFPNLQSPLKGKRFQTVSEIQENTMGQLIAIGRTVQGPKVSTLKGTEASLSYVQCFLYFISSVNISTFHSTWLHAFWTDLRMFRCKKRLVCFMFSVQNLIFSPNSFYFISMSKGGVPLCAAIPPLGVCE